MEIVMDTEGLMLIVLWITLAVCLIIVLWTGAK
jgi:hypothetical protein